jgi:hydrogenase maturation protease
MIPTQPAVLIGVGNPYRRDDGVGPALAAIISELDLPGLAVVTSDGEPSRLLDAWSGARLAVVVDAVRRDNGVPGQIRRHDITSDRPADGWTAAGSASTHGLGIGEAIDLAQAVDRMPETLIVFTVQAADIGYGQHLSQPVTASLPELTQVVLAELGSRFDRIGH